MRERIPRARVFRGVSQADEPRGSAAAVAADSDPETLVEWNSRIMRIGRANRSVPELCRPEVRGHEVPQGTKAYRHRRGVPL